MSTEVTSADLADRFAHLTTAHIADGCIRAGVAVRCAPHSIQGLARGARLCGRVLPVRHAGSVDVLLEAIDSAEPGDVLVVDNGDRLDESCVGDLVTLEAHASGLGGIVIWGLNRDTEEIIEIGLPLFSTGTLPTGPLRLDARHPDALTSATIGEWIIDRSDTVFGDRDGVIFVPRDQLAEVLGFAESIRDTETAQASRIRSGSSLRSQVRFAEFLAQREVEPELTLREHLRRVGGAIEV
jgi:regulator of RNase E activity RraA